MFYLHDDTYGVPEMYGGTLEESAHQFVRIPSHRVGALPKEKNKTKNNQINITNNVVIVHR